MASPTFGAAVDSAISRGQGITLGLTGQLSRIDLQLGRKATASQNLVLELRPLSGGLPSTTGAPLASLSVPPSAIPVGDFVTTYTQFDLGAQAFAVTAGQTLAITLASNTPDPNWYTWSTTSSAGTYAGGVPFFRSPPSGAWAVQTSSSDFGFRTFVTVPEPGTLSIAMFIGAAGLLVRRERSRGVRGGTKR